jgi:hypothetical protein
VNGFHIEVRKLVGNVEVGVADDLDLVGAMTPGRLAEVVFLVNDAFACVGKDGDLAESDFAVASSKRS